MIIGGDNCVGISHLDDNQIGNGELGGICRRIQEFLSEDRSNN